MVAALAGFAGYYFKSTDAPAPVAAGATHRLMLAPLLDPGGEPQSLSQWRGDILVVNFWATWCAPCREEIPALMRVHRKYASNGVKIVGIAMDNAVKVRDYAKDMRIDYTLLMGTGETLGIAKELGNQAGVLPFTIVLDRAGNIAYAHAGALTETALVAVLLPLL